MRYYEIAEAVSSANLNQRQETSPIVYHGGAEFDTFALQHDRHIGFFFTSNRVVAEDYAETNAPNNPVVYSAKLTYQNPLRADAGGKDNWKIRFEHQTLDVDDLCQIAKERGHDAVIVKNVDDTSGRFYQTSDVYVVWNASQIELLKKESTRDNLDETTEHAMSPTFKKVLPTRKSIEADPRVARLVDERPGGWFCNLAAGYEWSGQRSLGAETLRDIASLLNEVTPIEE